MADELIDILTPSGDFSGLTALKSEAHKHGLWHASVHIWIFTPNGEVLLQLRAKNKDTYPNLWDISVAGHLSCGDTATGAAIREIQEEIGLSISESSLLYLKTVKNSKHPSNTIIDNEFNNLYLLNYPINISKLNLQKEEVSAIKLLSIVDFEKELIDHPDQFVPHGMEYYHFIIKKIKDAII